MEYLSTYGLAVVVILVIIVTLFKLNLFATGIGPRAQPGACQVYRPYGVGSNIGIQLRGLCTPQMPQFVARLNGVNANITTQKPFVYNTLNGFTVSIWVKTSATSAQNYNSILIGETVPVQVPYYVGPSPTHTTFYLGGDGAVLSSCTAFSSTGLILNDTWTNIVLESGAIYPGGGNGVLFFSNGQAPWAGFGASVTSCISTPPNPIVIGSADGNGNFFNGSISNVQIYNASLTTNEILEIYQNGVGGPPVQLQNLVAWYPLNGDANDYSGNLNYSVAKGIGYISSG